MNNCQLSELTSSIVDAVLACEANPTANHTDKLVKGYATMLSALGKSTEDVATPLELIVIKRMKNMIA